MGRKTEAESFGDFAAGRISVSCRSRPRCAGEIAGGGSQSAAWSETPGAECTTHPGTTDPARSGATLFRRRSLARTDDERTFERGRPRAPEMPSAPGGWLQP